MNAELRHAIRQAIDQHRRRVVLTRCEECGEELTAQQTKYLARFCGRACQNRWWRYNTEAGRAWLVRHQRKVPA